MNSFEKDRRTLMKSTVALAAAMLVPAHYTRAAQPLALIKSRLEQLEQDFGGRIGLFALNTADNGQFAYRGDERFPFCSTFKAIVAAAVLHKSVTETGLLQRRIHYRQSDLIHHSPITGKNLATGMTMLELCAAVVQYSDNAASNLLVKALGGVASIMAYAASIGDKQFRLDRLEPGLGSAVPGDLRDTTTPHAMGLSLQRLVLGDALTPKHREQLKQWLLGNTTGATSIRAGVPGDWRVADKTGSGYYGTANDIAVLWPPGRPPVILAIYTTQLRKEAESRRDIIASAARIMVDWIAHS